MPYKVYHLNDEALFGSPTGSPKLSSELPREFIDAKMGMRDDGSQERACAELLARGLYRLVATVRARSLDEAWELTNHIDEPWTANPRVDAAAGPQRSSAVGDLFEDEQGVLHVCRSLGFGPLHPAGQPAAAPKRTARKP